MFSCPTIPEVLVALLVLGLCIAVHRAWCRWQRMFATAIPEGPQPPIVEGSTWLRPIVGAGLEWLSNPVVFLNECRKKHGDVFILKAFGLRLFFVFGEHELREFYGIREKDASFAEATRGFLGFKVPELILQSGDIKTVSRVLRGEHQRMWSAVMHHSMREEVARLESSIAGEKEGRIEDLFQWVKDCAHESGFRTWLGSEVGPYLVKCVQLFNKIDPEPGFTDMRSLVWTILTRRREENAALHELANVIDALHNGFPRRDPKDDFLAHLYSEHENLPPRERALQVAVHVLTLHMASQSNLYAAISWTIINLLQHPSNLTKVTQQDEELRREFGEDYLENEEALGRMGLLEQCFHESIRLAQQSLTLRLVISPIQIGKYRVVPGYYIATLLSCLNTESSLIKCGNQFQPEVNYLPGGRINPSSLSSANASYAISTFGHGTHACPGLRFAVYAAKIIISSLLSRFHLHIEGASLPIQIVETQIGAVGRTQNPVSVIFSVKR